MKDGGCLHFPLTPEDIADRVMTEWVENSL